MVGSGECRGLLKNRYCIVPRDVIRLCFEFDNIQSPFSMHSHNLPQRDHVTCREINLRLNDAHFTQQDLIIMRRPCYKGFELEKKRKRIEKNESLTANRTCYSCWEHNFFPLHKNAQENNNKERKNKKKLNLFSCFTADLSVRRLSSKSQLEKEILSIVRISNAVLCCFFAVSLNANYSFSRVSSNSWQGINFNHTEKLLLWKAATLLRPCIVCVCLHKNKE